MIERRLRSARSGTRARASLVAVGMLATLAGCTVVEAPSPDAAYGAPTLSRRDTEFYLQLPRIALTDGSLRWLVAPKAILELTNGFLNFEFTEEEGLIGSILSVQQDRDRLWIGTTRGLQSLDKQLHFFRTYAEETNLHAMFVQPYANGFAVAMTGRGAILVDAEGLNVEIHPEPAIDIREVTDAQLFEDDLWVSTFRGLYRFEIDWKRWNDNFGGKEVKRARVLRLERVPNVVGDQVLSESLYAVTETGLFAYDPTFDKWDRVGL